MSASHADGTNHQDDGRIDAASADDLMPAVYEKLSEIAASYLRREQEDQILEPNVLVNETYLRLARNPPRAWAGVDEFLKVAAAAMRRVLIDHARKRRAIKRGFGRSKVSLELITTSGPRDIDIRTLDEALKTLAGIDPKAAQVVEFRFFVGLTHEESARVLGVSRKTVVKKWTWARDWLAEELSDETRFGEQNAKLQAKAKTG